MAEIKDISGTRFNRLVVICFDHKIEKLDRKGKVLRYYYWRCRCDCGNEHIATYPSLVNGHTKSCGCLHKETAIRIGHNNAIGYKESSFNNLYYNYYRAARKRNLSFELTKEQFMEITSSDCFYCGREPAQINHGHLEKYNGVYVCNGVDRVDNSKGYKYYNCVPCCKVCNTAKSTMILDEFYAWIERIYNRHIKEVNI